MTEMQARNENNKVTQNKRLLNLRLKSLGVTELESLVLRSIAENYMTELNGDRPESLEEIQCGIWTESIDDSGVECPTGKVLSGVVSSLVKKELVWIQKDGRDSLIGLEEQGFKAYKGIVL